MNPRESKSPIPDGYSRRSFVKAMSTALGANIVFANWMPQGLVPVLLAQSPEPFSIPSKPGLTILNDRPLNAETAAHLLNDPITPASRLFVRNNGLPPVTPDPNTWKLTIAGESVVKSKTYTLKDLKTKFKHIDLALTLECGGNGRAEFYPPASGNQWTIGAVGCPVWNGVRLKDVLEDCGIKKDAVYVAYHSADRHLSQDPTKDAISRGVPITKALEKESMIAWGMNGEPLPSHHGFPLRMVCGGWPGSTSGKWVKQIDIRNIVHDGTKMSGGSYQVPMFPVKAGATVPAEAMKIIESMPVKSLITYPQSGAEISTKDSLKINGHAWAGDLSVSSVSLSIDFGQTWIKTALKKPINRLAWQQWSAKIKFPKKGYYEVWTRAIDSEGTSQPMLIPGWNPKGYLNNSCHRIAVYVA